MECKPLHPYLLHGIGNKQNLLFIGEVCNASNAPFCCVCRVWAIDTATSGADTGSVDIIISALSTPSVVQMEGTTVTARGGTGTITFVHSSGEPFTEGASAAVQFASFSKKTASGFELEADGAATFESGDILNLVFK